MIYFYSVLAALTAIVVTFVLSMRYKWPPVLDLIRRTNKRIFNPRQMRTAGTPGAYAGIVHHIGRRSGNEYQTPVGVVADDDEMFVVLPYGTRPDWLKNVVHAGIARVTHEGETFEVTDPRVTEIRNVPEVFGSTEQMSQRVFGVDHCLRLRVVGSH